MTTRRWIDVVDLISVTVIVLAVFVGVFGGFRLRVADVRLSLTSGLRLAFIGAALVGVRHLVTRERPLHARVMTGVARAWRSEAARAVRPVFIASRLGVLAVGYLAVVIIGYPQRPAFRVSENEFQNLPARWDSGWYLGIASEGYRWDPRIDRQQNVAFFPAFPLAMRAAALLLGVRAPATDGTSADFIERYHATFLFAGVAVSLAAFFGALVYLHRLAREDLGMSPEAASTSFVFLAAYPFALYYSAAYSEGLFLLTVAGAIYHFRRDQLVAAACWGAVAGLTRPNGFLLCVPLAVFIAERQFGWLDRWRSRFDPSATAAPATGEPARVRLASVLAAGAPVAGMLAYSAFLYRTTGRAFAWAEVHEAAWGRAFVGVNALVTDHYRYIAEHGLYQYTASVPLDVLNGVAALLALVAVWPVTRRFGIAYGLFILANVLPPLLAGGLLSMGRLTSVVFPIFLWLGVVVPPAHRAAWTCAFAVLEGFGAALFFTWRPFY